MVGNKGNEYLDVNDDRCEINEKHPENGECSIKINVAVTNKIAAISMIRKIAENENSHVTNEKQISINYVIDHFSCRNLKVIIFIMMVLLS